MESTADIGRRGTATAFGVQGYTYDGPSSTTINLDFNLHGSVGQNSTGYANNKLRSDVAVLIGSDLAWYPDFSTLVYEIVYGYESENAGIESLFISRGDDVNTSSSIAFDIDVGEDFYVIASMGASARNGYADAWNTLTLSFQDDTGLTAVSAGPVNSVAEPGTFLLLSTTGLLFGVPAFRKGLKRPNSMRA